ncbi:MAG: hypothetical protein A2Z74_05635 [Chloroflexi bacterium RBG_13_46_9]|jgi:hypothetical protein|nr:MAG: hypothetical protein A2Z74_05635 [Chloroflexi bacterium RBG_13_46_9]
MKSSNRFLLGFGIAITILVVITITLVLTNRGMAPLLPENTPQGTVQRFLLAVQDHDLQKAYSYLDVQESGRKLTYDDWIQSVSPRFQTSSPAWKATFGKTSISNNTATVEVLIDIFEPAGPFDNPIRTQIDNYQLKQENGKWFITSRPWLYWFY